MAMLKFRSGTLSKVECLPVPVFENQLSESAFGIYLPFKKETALGSDHRPLPAAEVVPVTPVLETSMGLF